MNIGIIFGTSEEDYIYEPQNARYARAAMVSIFYTSSSRSSRATKPATYSPPTQKIAEMPIFLLIDIWRFQTR